MDWARCKAAFHQDGSLRDIYVNGTGEHDWDLFLSLVRSSGHAVRYTRDGDDAVVPSSAADVLADKTCAHNLTIDVDGVEFMCHFFTPDEIELDLDPRQVASQRSLEAVLGFIEHLGSHLSKDVILTEENSPEYIRFRYSCSDGSTQYVSTGQPGDAGGRRFAAPLIAKALGGLRRWMSRKS